MRLTSIPRARSHTWVDEWGAPTEIGTPQQHHVTFGRSATATSGLLRDDHERTQHLQVRLIVEVGEEAGDGLRGEAVALCDLVDHAGVVAELLGDCQELRVGERRVEHGVHLGGGRQLLRLGLGSRRSSRRLVGRFRLHAGCRCVDRLGCHSGLRSGVSGLVLVDHDGVHDGLSVLDRLSDRTEESTEGGAVQRVALDVELAEECGDVAQHTRQEVSLRARVAAHVDELGVGTDGSHRLADLRRNGDLRRRLDLGDAHLEVCTVVGSESFSVEALNLGLCTTLSQGCGSGCLTLSLRHLRLRQTSLADLSCSGFGGAVERVGFTLCGDAGGVRLGLRVASGDLGSSLGVDLGLLGLGLGLDLLRLLGGLGLRHIHLTAGDSGGLGLLLTDDRDLSLACCEFLVAALTLELSSDVGVGLGDVGLGLDLRTAQCECTVLFGDGQVTSLLGGLGGLIGLGGTHADGLVGLGLDDVCLAATLLPVLGGQVLVVVLRVRDLADVQRDELEPEDGDRLADVLVDRFGEVGLLDDEVRRGHRCDDLTDTRLQRLLDRVIDVAIEVAEPDDELTKRFADVAVLVERRVSTDVRRPCDGDGHQC